MFANQLIGHLAGILKNTDLSQATQFRESGFVRAARQRSTRRRCPWKSIEPSPRSEVLSSAGPVTLSPHSPPFAGFDWWTSSHRPALAHLVPESACNSTTLAADDRKTARPHLNGRGWAELLPVKAPACY